MNDRELLQRFTEGDQESFSRLVKRHVDLVYSVARRQARRHDLAQDVVQAVFLDLARHAGKLRTHPQLSAWLHVVTRRKAIDTVRREVRRAKWERLASEDDALKPENDRWSEIEPLLDEAVAALPSAERRALLLRYFEKKSLQEVGSALAISDDAAQKRVGRAIDRLRSWFSTKGVAATAAGVASGLSAHAVQAAPAAMSDQVSAAIMALGPFEASATTSTLAKKIVTAVLLATSAAVLVLENQLLAGARLRSQQAGKENALMVSELQAIPRSPQQPAAVPPTSSPEAEDPLFASLRLLFVRMEKLKDAFDQMPEQRIPEMAFLRESDWLEVVRQSKLDDVSSFQRALASVRTTAKSRALSRIMAAYRLYTEKTGGVAPADIKQLASRFKPPLDLDLLQRYELVAEGRLDALPRRSVLLREKRSMLVDPEFDSLWEMTAEGGEAMPARDNAPRPFPDGYQDVLNAAARAHFAQKGRPGTLNEYLPYVPDPTVRTNLQHIMAWFQGQAALQPVRERYRNDHRGDDPKSIEALVPYFANSAEALTAVELERNYRKALTEAKTR